MDLKISIKSMGKAFYIPLIINDVIIPLVIWIINENGSDYNLDQGVYMITQMFTPFLASFWIYLHLIKYVDMKGNESFYIKNRNKCGEVLKLFVLYIITNTPFFLWYTSLNKKYALEWVHIVIVSFLFASAAYFLSFMLKSISLALIPSFIYMLASVTELNPLLNKISFFEYEGMTSSQITSRYSYFVIVAIMFISFGEILNKHHKQYNL